MSDRIGSAKPVRPIVLPDMTRTGRGQSSFFAEQYLDNATCVARIALTCFHDNSNVTPDDGDGDCDGDIDICWKPWNGDLHVYLENVSP